MFTITSRRLSRYVTPDHSEHEMEPSRLRRTAGGLLTRRLGAAVLAAVPVMAVGLTLPASASADPPATITRNFGSTGSAQTFTVPGGVAFLDLVLEGGGGGDGGPESDPVDLAAIFPHSHGGTGGSAGRVTGTLAVKPGERINFFVGGGGKPGCDPNGSQAQNPDFVGSGGTGVASSGGGDGGNRYCEGAGGGGGGGGGATIVYLNVPVNVGTPVAVAGGGGGGGGGGALNGNSDGGNGGGVSHDGDGGNGQGGGAGGTAGAAHGGTAGATGGTGQNNPGPEENGGGGGGGGGYPNAGGGGFSAPDNHLGAVGAGGGAGGDSYYGSFLLFGGVDPSARGNHNDGLLTITYKAPIDEAWASATPTTSTPGQPVTYWAKVEDYAGVTTPTGTVRFSVGSTTLCTAALSPDSETYAAGSGSCQASNAPVGTDTVLASYSGDATFPANSQTTFTETVSLPADTATAGTANPPVSREVVSAVGTTTVVTANPPTSNEGDLVKYRTIVRPVSGTAIPTGTVTFTMGNTQLCNKPIPLDAKGEAECKSPKAPLGSGTVTATYSGAPAAPRALGFTGSTGTTTVTVSARVAALTTTTSVTADPPTATQGSPVTYIATAHPPAGKTTPTGTVSFTAGPKATPLCTAAIPLNGVGNAKCTSPRAPVGTDTVTATYRPADGSFTGSSGTTTEAVTASQTAPSSQH